MTLSMPIFDDFEQYLDRYVDGAEVKADILTGGYTNRTCRATFDPPILIHGVQKLRTVILKYAPPCLPCDPSQAMTVGRQLVEAKALRLLTGIETSFPDLVALLRSQTKLRVPQLIFHDTESNVLWIEDLGKTQSLSAFLLAPGSAGRWREIAVELGEFLAQLFAITRNPPSSLVEYLDQNSDHTGIHEYLTNKASEDLRSAGIEDAEVLAEWVRQGLHEMDKEGVCLGMIDFWPGNVLIGEDGRCSLVDWEYFGVSSAASELGMFLGDLQVHILNSTSSEEGKGAIRSFAHTMLAACATSISGRPSRYFKRRMLLAHGRGLVNGSRLYATELDEASKRRVLEAGVRSLRAAGKVEEATNAQLLEEDPAIWDAFLAMGFDGRLASHS